jgi:hypothetical protein
VTAIAPSPPPRAYAGNRASGRQHRGNRHAFAILAACGNRDRDPRIRQ